MSVKNITKIKNTNIFNKVPKILIMLLSTSFILSSNIHADTESNSFPQPSVLGNDSQSNVIQNSSKNQYSSPLNLGDQFKSNASAVGFDLLYGSNRDLFVYNGEVSSAFENDENGYRQLNIEEIAGLQRNFAVNPTKGEEKGSPVYEEAKNRDEFHWYSMLGSDKSAHPFLSILTSIQNMSKSLIQYSIQLSGFDMTTINDIMENSGIESSLSQIFLFSTDDGMSPLFVIAIVGFIIGLLSMGFQYSKGKMSMKSLLQEVGILFIAGFISALCMSPGNLGSLSEAGLNMGNALSNEIATVASPNLSVYRSETGDARASSITTQQSILNSSYVNAWIQAEFGMPIEDLNLFGGTFGSDTVVKNAIANVANKKSQNGEYTNPAYTNGDMFAITTSKDNLNTTNNLGMYLWAANSNVSSKANSNEANPFYWSDSKNALVPLTSKELSDGSKVSYDYSRSLFVIDFLQEINATEGLPADVKNNVQTMIYHLSHPNTGQLAFQVFLLTILDFVLIFASFSILILMMVGKITIVIGVYTLIIFPILLLIPQTRSLTKKMLVTYLMGFIRFTLGTTIFNTLFAITSIFTQKGTTGIFIAMIIASILAKFGPKMIREFNTNLNSMARNMGGELEIAQKANQAVFNMKNNADNQLGRRKAYDHDGNQLNRRDASRTKNMISAIQQGKNLNSVIREGVFKYGKDPRLANRNADFGDGFSNDSLVNVTADADLYDSELEGSQIEELNRFVRTNMNSSDILENEKGYEPQNIPPKMKVTMQNKDSEMKTSKELEILAMQKTKDKLNRLNENPNILLSNDSRKDWESDKLGKRKWAPIKRAKEFNLSNPDLTGFNKSTAIVKDSLDGLKASDKFNRKALAAKNLTRSIAAGTAIKTASYIPGIGDKVSELIIASEHRNMSKYENVRKKFESTAEVLRSEEKEVTVDSIAQRQAEETLTKGLANREQVEKFKNSKDYDQKLNKEKEKITKVLKSIKSDDLSKTKENLSSKHNADKVSDTKLKEGILEAEKGIIRMKEGSKKEEALEKLKEVKENRKIKLNSKTDKVSIKEIENEMNEKQEAYKNSQTKTNSAIKINKAKPLNVEKQKHKENIESVVKNPNFIVEKQIPSNHNQEIEKENLPNKIKPKKPPIKENLNKVIVEPVKIPSKINKLDKKDFNVKTQESPNVLKQEKVLVKENSPSKIKQEKAPSKENSNKVLVEPVKIPSKNNELDKKDFNVKTQKPNSVLKQEKVLIKENSPSKIKQEKVPIKENLNKVDNLYKKSPVKIPFKINKLDGKDFNVKTQKPSGLLKQEKAPSKENLNKVNNLYKKEPVKIPSKNNDLDKKNFNNETQKPTHVLKQEGSPKLNIKMKRNLEI